MAASQGDPIDVFGHSFGAICVFGAAGRGAQFRRIALYEPPGPQTGNAEWLERVSDLIAEGKPGRAMFSLITEVVGLTPAQFEGYRPAPGAKDVLPIVSATLGSEARALMNVEPCALAAGVEVSVLLFARDGQPPVDSRDHSRAGGSLSGSSVATLAGDGHDAIDVARGLVASEPRSFFGAA